MMQSDPLPPRPPGELNPTADDYQRAQAESSHHEHSSKQDPHGEATVSLAAYLGVWAALMVLLFVTVGAAFVHLGPFNLFVALLIACIKAGLVVWIFMHVQISSRLVKIFVVATLLWLSIMFVLTYADYWTRHDLPMSQGWIAEKHGIQPGLHE